MLRLCALLFACLCLPAFGGAGIPRLPNPMDGTCKARMPAGEEPALDLSGYSDLVHEAVLSGKRQDPDHSVLGKNIVLLDTPVGICTGVVIERDIILTAAHCANRMYDPADVKVGFSRKGKNGKRELEWRTTLGIEVHGNYEEAWEKLPSFGVDPAKMMKMMKNSPAVHDDIALLRLSSPAPADFRKAPLAAQPVISKNCRYFIAGFGATKGDPNVVSPEAAGGSLLDLDESQMPFAHELEVPFASLSKFRRGGKILLELKGAGSICRGDSGGPLVEVCGNQKRVIGITSVADDGCLEGVFVNVHGHRPWIQQKAKELRSLRGI